MSVSRADGPEAGSWSERAGVAVGVVSGILVAILGIVFLVDNPYGGAETGPWTLSIFGMSTLLAATAVIAAMARQWVLLAVLFAFSFILLGGFYLLMTPGLYRWIGVGDLGYLAAALLLWRAAGGRSISYT